MRPGNATFGSSGAKPAFWICAFLAFVTLLLYWPVTKFEFVHFDDTDYVATNTVVQAGLSSKSISWAFQNDVARNWHPLTLISHMADCQVYGLNPGRHHLTNVFFHIANTLLIFLLLQRLTGALWRSAIVAALFAWHPLHVESVAWVAERKDVLSTLFWLLTIWAYYGYATFSRTGSNPSRKGEQELHAKDKPSKRWSLYAVALLCFALGLMSKPMLVTLPFTLLLLDFWPLRRFAFHPKKSWAILVVEKIPFFAMSTVVCWITFSVQKKGGAVLGGVHLPLASRLSNALISYVRYLGKMIWPENLAGLYLKQGDWAGGLVLGAALLLVVVSWFVIRHRHTRGYMVTGWCWYLGTLVPVIGIVQVGMQAMADRYTYVPLIGIFVMFVWGGCELASRLRVPALVSGVVVCGMLVACMTATRCQIPHWRDSESLFLRMIAVSPGNYMAHYNLANDYSRSGQLDKAIEHYTAALESLPSYGNAHNNLAGVLLKQKRFDEAVEHYKKAAQISPDCVQYFNLANACAESGKVDQALAYYRESLRLNPNYHDAWKNMATVLTLHGRNDELISLYRSALQSDPNSESVHLALANTLANCNRIDEAIPHYEAAQKLNASNPESFNGLGICYAIRGNYGKAAEQFEQTLRLNPKDSAAHGNLANALSALNRFEEAIPHYAAAIEFNPKDYQAHFNLGLSYAKQGKRAEAERNYREALRINPQYSEAEKALKQLL